MTTRIDSSIDINPDKELLREYFGEYWPKQRISNWMDLYEWTGKRLIDEVEDHENSGFGTQLPFWKWNLNHHIMLTQTNRFEVTEFMPDNWSTELPNGDKISLQRQYCKWEAK